MPQQPAGPLGPESEDLLSELARLEPDSSFLRDMKGKDAGFRVPSGYFDQEPGWEDLRKEAGRIRPTAAQTRRRRFPQQLPLRLAGIAAAFLLVVAGFRSWRIPGTEIPPLTGAGSPATLSSIPADELEGFVRDNLHWIETDLIRLAGIDPLASESPFSESEAASFLEKYLDEFTAEDLSEDI